MIRKFATILALTVLAAPGIHAQQAPAAQSSSTQQDPAQQPAAQQPSAPQPAEQQPAATAQDASDEDMAPRRKRRAPDHEKWTYNLGVGGNLPNGNTMNFVKGGGLVGAAGVARNANRIVGLRLDFQWAQLPLRTSALAMGGAQNASSHVYSLNLGPIINFPVTKKYGGYVVFGPSYYHRSGELYSSTVVPGAPCNAFFDWWGRCTANSVSLFGNFAHESLNQLGYNFGAGVTRKLTGKFELYAEFRYEHGTHDKITTDYRPISVGVRW
jgi:opacity protein-like surface antigen